MIWSGIGRPSSTRATRTGFGSVTSTFNLLTLLLFWFLGGFNLVDQFVRSFGFNPIVTGLLFIGSLSLLRMVLFLPFHIYSTFVIEVRFAFNRTTPKIFVLDLLKGVLLSVILDAPLLAGVYALFEYGGPPMWFYCWLAVACYSLIMAFVYPIWIMPIFNKFTPLADGELRSAILAYAGKVRFPLKDIVVMDGSKRSRHSNAFFTGFGRNKRVVLFDTLIAQQTVPALVSVFAHEVGHYKKKHVIWFTVASIAQQGVMFFLVSLFLNNRDLFTAFYMTSPSVYGSMVLFGMLYQPLAFVLSLLFRAVSRQAEYAADRYAADTIEQPEALADALKKLIRDNLGHLTPHPFYVWLNYTHPPLLARIRAIRARAGNPA